MYLCEKKFHDNEFLSNSYRDCDPAENIKNAELQATVRE